MRIFGEDARNVSVADLCGMLSEVEGELSLSEVRIDLRVITPIEGITLNDSVVLIVINSSGEVKTLGRDDHLVEAQKKLGIALVEEGKIKNRTCRFCGWETPTGAATHGEKCWIGMSGFTEEEISLQLVVTTRLGMHHAKEHPRVDFVDEEWEDFRKQFPI